MSKKNYCPFLTIFDTKKSICESLKTLIDFIKLCITECFHVD